MNLGSYLTRTATFTPDARFTDQALGNDNKIVPYGVSTVAQARTQARNTSRSTSGNFQVETA